MFLLLASCNSLLGVHEFDHDAAIAVADVPVDLSLPVDVAMPDADLPFCVIKPTSAATAGDSLGNSGMGMAAATLVCPSGELPVGFRFDMSAANPPNWFQPAVLSLTMRCGTVAKPATGAAYATTLGTAVKVTAGGNGVTCNGWPTIAVGSELDCPSGSVFAGFHATEDINTSNEAESMFNSLTATCRSLDSTGKVTSTTTATLGYANTGTNADLPQNAACANGETLVQLAPRTGCGIDAVTLACAPTACQ